MRQRGSPGARGSCGCGAEAAEATRQRRRATEALAATPPKRIRKAGIPTRSDRIARRFVAVKSSAFGSPHISPITAPSDGHARPSSIVQSTSPAWRAQARISLSGSPPKRASARPWGCPTSCAHMRSCTHRIDCARGTCARAKPTAPTSRESAKTSTNCGFPGSGGDWISAVADGSASCRSRAMADGFRVCRRSGTGDRTEVWRCAFMTAR